MSLPCANDDPHGVNGREVVLRFRPQEDGRMRASWGGRAVIAGREYENSTHIKKGERWRVLLHDKTIVIIAEPIARESAALPPPCGRHDAAPSPSAPDAQGPPPAPPLGRAEAPPVEGVSHPAASPPPRSLTTPPMRLHGAEVEPSDVIRPDERVAFFIDAASLFFGARDLDIDWTKLIDFLLGNARFADAYFYVPGNCDHGFLDNLAHAGYTIRRKRVKPITDPATGMKIAKANLDTDIVLDMLTTAPTFDVAYLVSGGSDFARVIDYLRQRGRRVYVVGSRGTLSRDLTRCANKPIYHLEDFATRFCRIPAAESQSGPA